ncbi:GAF domain-containing protein [Kutzneria viridogrisea]|uniref:ANTAR domain-containing protein n=2 Tax=Kutzneria TaxID=43356 RepID=W5WCA2_9PSEU|nr:GAF and ANTAR domain-containing protein [Kutzneria albida]AHH98788.1 hypothetical protein KALB_5426 [Kutzneria albida DSM 43870]MBA8923695.1 hypothetical protein [Kutzneria viridogrisea]
MIDDEVERAYETICACARQEGVPVSVRHIALACKRMLAADGVGIYFLGGLGLGESVYSTDEGAERVVELQVTLGEGPALAALNEDHQVLVANLTCGLCDQSWPVFTPAAVREGLRAIFAFPLKLGVVSVGALEIYRARQGALSDADLNVALLFADAVMIKMVNQTGDTQVMNGDISFLDQVDERWKKVHQATGAVAVQLHAGLADAFVCMRAYAYRSDRRLSEVADDILNGVLDITTDDRLDPGSSGSLRVSD